MLSKPPDHDWVEYNAAKGPKSFPGRRPNRLCRACGIADRRDGTNPPCIPVLPQPQLPVLKELR